MSSTPGMAEIASEDCRTLNSLCVSSYHKSRTYSSSSWPSDAACTSAAPLERATLPHFLEYQLTTAHGDGWPRKNCCSTAATT
eukprot:4528329-Lingulodinium_polyedra.AAC.1